MASEPVSSPARAGATDAGEPLAERYRRLHRALIDGILATGQVPSVSDLAERLAMRPETVRAGLGALRDADYLAFDAAGEIGCLYPFSPVPTPHVLVVDGRRRHAMCAIDALGVAAMLGREIAIEDVCAVCGTPIRLGVRPGAVVRAEPAATVVVARRGRDEPAYEACCPFTLFACDETHAEALVGRTPGTLVMSLAAALARGEEIFGGMLAETLPARRPRARGGESAG